VVRTSRLVRRDGVVATATRIAWNLTDTWRRPPCWLEKHVACMYCVPAYVSVVEYEHMAPINPSTGTRVCTIYNNCARVRDVNPLMHTAV
jgi:hypothetical protein